MRYLVVVALASGCSGGGGKAGGWVFTADVIASRANGPVDLAAGASLSVGSGSFHLEGTDVGSDCEHTISFDVPAPLAVQTYELAGFGGPMAGYTDCAWNNYVIRTNSGGGQLTVTRADSSCAQPPCIDATFGFVVSAPVAPHPALDFTISDGHVSNY